ncbi:MAG: acetyl-CoA C-acyltransferase, partial [Phaeodactylibacter sp.]|nr:acetyl-CoA C-acyltransferase [Phaeodactylibacter sp.]
MTEAFIYDAIRTPRGKGKPGGALYEVRPLELLGALLVGLKERYQLDTSLVEDLLLGCVTPIGDQGYNVGKAALLYADWSDRVPALQLNRYCASGLETVNLCAAKVQAGLGRLFLAGGLESMSRVRMGSDGGALLTDPELISRVPYLPQGVAADLIAT